MTPVRVLGEEPRPSSGWYSLEPAVRFGFIGAVLLLGLLAVYAEAKGRGRWLENGRLPSWYSRPRYVHSIYAPSDLREAATWTGWAIFRRCQVSTSHVFEASTLDEIETRLRRGLPKKDPECWYVVGPTDRDYTSF